MGGGLMQLVAYGAQDVYLTGNPQITFFKVVYRRHTNFSLETVEHTLGGNPQFGRKSTVTVTRNGDLATKMYLKVKLTAIDAKGAGNDWGYVKRLGHALIKSVEVEIGGSKIDKQYGVWLDVWYELTHATGQERGYANMIGDVPELTDINTDAKPSKTLYIPLQFWFNRNTGLALPLIALQYHEVRVHFEFNTADSLVNYKGTVPEIAMDDASLLVDYVYLDSEERRRFAQVGHEYLIEQLQFTGEESANDTNGKYKLGFNHPTKEIVWCIRSGKFIKQKFLGLTPDDVAVELVRAQFIKAAAGVGTTEANAVTNLLLGTTSITIDEEITGVNTWSYVTAGANVGGLLSKINSATVRITDNALTVTSVTHTITVADVTASGAEIGTGTDTRSTATAALSAKSSGITVTQWNNYGIYIDGTGNPIETALIQLNGHDRFDTREGAYFNYVQPHQHHSNTPADGINVYSFALHPQQHQPSGTANLSRIDNTQLNIRLVANFADNANLLYIFGFSYNVFRVMSGMGGLAYSN